MYGRGLPGGRENRYYSHPVHPPGEAGKAAEYLCRADELCDQRRRRVRAYQIRFVPGPLRQSVPQKHKAVSADDHPPRRGLLFQGTGVIPAPFSLRKEVMFPFEQGEGKNQRTGQERQGIG